MSTQSVLAMLLTTSSFKGRTVGAIRQLKTASRVNVTPGLMGHASSRLRRTREPRAAAGKSPALTTQDSP